MFFVLFALCVTDIRVQRACIKNQNNQNTVEHKDALIVHIRRYGNSMGLIIV